MEQKICLIINPKSGQSSWEIIRYQSLIDIIEFFSSRNIPITIKTTGKAGDGKGLTLDSIKENYTHIIACGGDGTINEVVNGIVGSNAIMGIIPLGTENILAKAMSIPLDIKEACRYFLAATVKTWDVGVANGRHFLIMSGIGLDGQVVSQMETEKKLKKATGKYGFIWKGAKMIFGEEGQERTFATIRFPDENIEYKSDVRLIVIGNLPNYGGSLKLTLKAKPDDGKLDVIVFPYKDEMDVVTKLLEVVTETHLESGEVPYFTSTNFEIITDPPVYCQIDGELLGKTPIHYRVKPLAIKVKF